MLEFKMLNPSYTEADLGMLPFFAWESNPKSAKEQINDNYRHGGGWQSFQGFTFNKDTSISYPNDPPQHPIAIAKLRDEVIFVYEGSWVLILQPDRSYDVARID